MIFNSDIFLFAFLPAVFSLFWLSTTKQQRYVLLTVSGYVFYGYWDWRFCFLLLFSSLVSFVAALRIDRAVRRTVARRWMVGSVTVDLCILGFFKYYNFLAANLQTLAQTFVLGGAPPLLDIVLPIGISFYTFHTISYIVDVADGRVRPTRNLFEYLTYVGLFSQLVAGPIVRFRQIEDDLEHVDAPPRSDYMAKGLGFFVVGMIKKVIIADSLARYVNLLLADHHSLSMAGSWLAALGYTFQLYYDFSGYSDMAVGLGYMFGIRIPQNFDAPYKAAGIRDFWRRWHISLSTWLRDYLYIRLGGNQLGAGRTHANLLVTMLLGGLWHGANWTFIVWGLYHAVLLIFDREWGRWLAALPTLVYRWSTFSLVVVGWVFFRAESLSMAVEWLEKMVGIGVGASSAPDGLLVLVVACFIAVNLLPETWHFRWGLSRRWAVVYALGFVVAYLFMNGRETVFLYYQF